MAHATYTVQLDDRGRLVLPAPLRERLQVADGGRLLLTLDEDGSVRLVPARTVVSRFQGAFRDRYGDRSLVDELLAERRAEADREAAAVVGR
jgi:AbrB family looped-hinge helix DNA binding protein